MVDEATRRLLMGTQSMDDIVKMIQKMAGQINMLALNATTRNSGEIVNLQAVAGDVAEKLAAIRGAIDAVRGYVIATCSAMEAQSAVA